jgi:hypothetical protein
LKCEALTLQKGQLVGFARPFFGVGQWFFHFRNTRPDLGQFCVELQENLLVSREFVLGKNCVDGALWLAERAIYAFIRMDHQKVGTFVKAIYGTDLHAIRMFTLNAVFTYNERHSDFAS